MNKEEIELRIKEINSEISKLRQEKSELEKQLISQADTFEEKFKAWWDSDNKEYHGSIPNTKENPLVRKWYDRHRDPYRMEECDICEDMGEYFCHWNDYEYARFEDSWTEEDIKERREIAEELIKTNLGGFTYDW